MLKWLSLTNLQKKEFDRFIYLTSKLLDRHYQALFMSTNLHKATLTHSWLLNKHRKNETNENLTELT